MVGLKVENKTGVKSLVSHGTFLRYPPGELLYHPSAGDG